MGGFFWGEYFKVFLDMPFIDHFEFLAPIYDRIIKLHDPKRLIGHVGLPVNGILLDVGGGTGRDASAVSSMVSQCIVADLSIGMLIEAKGKDGLHTVCSRSELLPFRDAIFDRVLMVDALHHVYDQELTASELWRVVKPGGRIVIEEPDVRTLPVMIVAIAEKLVLMQSHFLPPPRIQQLFSFKNAKTRIERDGYTSWVIIEKLKI